MAHLERIAFLCHPYHRGGVTRWMADAAVAAAKAGTQVWFVTVTPAKPFTSAGGREPMAHLLSSPTPHFQLISEPVGFVFEFGAEQYRTYRYVTLIEANVPAGTPIIVSDDMAVWAAAAAVADKYPMVGVLHGDQDVYADMGAKFEKQLSMAVCVSRRVKERFKKRTSGLSASKITVIPCGIVLPAEKQRVAKPGTTRLAFIGRLTDYEKRAYDLVTICATLHREGFSFTLDVAGSSAEAGEEYRKKFADHGINNLVTFHGWLGAGEIQRLLSATDIVMLTSNSEGMPLVMMEALGAGCGFVGTRVSGIEDYEKHPLAGDCVRVYPVGDTAAACQAIKDISGIDANERSSAARNLAEREFTMEVCLLRYEEALQGLHCKGITPMRTELSPMAKMMSHLRAIARYTKVKLLAK